MRRCISSERKEYNEQEQFASYTVEKRDGTRSYIVQFVREQGGSEQFHQYFLEDSAGPGVGERVFRTREKIINRNVAVDLLAEDGAHCALNIVPKDKLEIVITLFKTANAIRANGLSQALVVLCKPIIAATGIDINPVELLSTLIKAVAEKKVENRPFCILM